MDRVALILVQDGLGNVLFGRRRDNSKWSLVGGHIEPGEDPHAGAMRELFEEAGFAPRGLTFLREHCVPGGPVLYCFTALCPGTPHNSNDPDAEFSEFKWVPVKDGVPKEIHTNLQGSQDDNNLVRQVYDLQKSETTLLLKHPNPKERALALKLNTTTPHDVALAALDPDEWVAHCAVLHPHHAEHALNAIAANTHDLDGVPIWHRHDELLADPRLTPHHIDQMYAATLVAALPEGERIQRLAILAAHPQFPLTANTLAARESGLPVGDLSKSEWAHKLIAAQPTAAADHSKEEVPPHLQHLAEAFKSGAHNGLKPEDSDLHETGDLSPKAIYKTPHAGGHHTIMVKPYTERENPRSGWAELTSQALYHAGGIGHLHQQVFPVEHGIGPYKAPAVGINIEPNLVPATNQHKSAYEGPRPEQARQISMMDYLTGNGDRHAGNLMARPDGTLLAIDHAGIFHPEDDDSIPFSNRRQTYEAPARIAPTNEPEYWAPALTWWSQKSPGIRQAFDARAALLSDQVARDKVSKVFHSRADWLDARARESAIGQLQPGWHKMPPHRSQDV